MGFATLGLAKAVKSEGTFEEYQRFLKKGANPNGRSVFFYFGESILDVAIKNKNADACMALLRYGGVLTSISTLTKDQKEFIFRRLVDCVSLVLRDKSELRQKRIHTIMALIEDGIDLTEAQKGLEYPFLIQASMMPDRELIELLVDAGANVNVTD